MKKIYVIFFLSVQFAYGQPTPYDSLESRLAIEKSDENKLELLSQLVTVAFDHDLRKGLEYARQGVALADKTGNKKWKPKFYEIRGRVYANLLELDSATIFFDKAMTEYTAIGDKKGQATTYFKIGWVFKKRGEIEQGMNADMKALKLMESLGDQRGIGGAYDRLSEDLRRQGRLKEAMHYAMASIDICKKNGFTADLVYAYFNAGDVYMAMGDFKQSLVYYSETVKLASKGDLGDMDLTGFINSRGNAFKRLGRYPEALKDYETALSLAQRTNYPNGISAGIANLGEINLLMGNYEKALAYQLETVRLQEKDSDFTNLVENYLHVSTIYEKLGNFKPALQYQKKALALRDSLATAKSDEAMSKMLTQYETKKKEATIVSQQVQLSQQRLLQWLGGGVVVLLAGFLFFGYRSYRARTKNNRLLAIKNAENELLLKEIHHRVKNNLEVVSGLLALQSAQIDDPHTKEAMQESQNRVQSIGIVHQKLYQGTNLGSIEMKDYFLDLSESILDSFGADKRVTIECAMEKLDVDIDTAVPLGLIVNELLTNTLKYAFPKGQDGNVLIRLEKRKDGVLHLEVSDNGVGKSGITHGTGFGGQLVSLLTRQLGGSMWEETKNGTRIFFDFKMDQAA